MLNPREEIILDAVAEVVRDELKSVRQHVDSLAELTTAHETAVTAVAERIKDLPPAVDVTPITARLTELEARPLPEVTPDTLKDVAAQWQQQVERHVDTIIEQAIERIPDVAPLTERIVQLEARAPVEPLASRLEAVEQAANDLLMAVTALPASYPAPTDLTPLEMRVVALEGREFPPPEVTLDLLVSVEERIEALVKTLNSAAVTVMETRIAELPPPPDLAPITERQINFSANIENLHERLTSLEAKPPVDLAPLTAKVDELQQTALDSHDKLVDALDVAAAAVDRRFAELPAPPPDLTNAVLALESSVAKIKEGMPSMEALTERTYDVFATVQKELREQMHDEVTAQVEKAVKALPPPPKGEKGENGTSVTVDQVRELLDATFAKWALEVERRIMDRAEDAIARMPKAKDGVDGIGVEDMQFESLDSQTLEIRWLRDGQVVQRHTHRFATPHDEGVWKAGVDYRKGAGVSWGGSWFIAQCDSPKGKPEESRDWRLAVKRGRDGSKGEPGRKGDKGEDGKNGRNLTALMPDGSRTP